MRGTAACLLAAALVTVMAGGCSRENAASNGPDGSAKGSPVATSGSAAAKSNPRSESLREVTLPAGTHLPIVLETTVGSDISHAEEAVHAHLARAIDVQGTTVLPEGSRLSGVVTDATPSGKVKGRAHVALRFDTVVPSGEDQRYQIDTTAVGRTAPSTKKKDALEIGGGAAGGALIGALIGGGKGAAIGSVAGGGAGTAIVLSTKGQEIHLPRGAALTLRLEKPLTVRVRG